MLSTTINVKNTIPEFFSGKNVFITGATGFMGKVLLEKLLLHCSDIGTIYLLMRPGKRLTIQQKLEKVLKNPLFDSVRSEEPSVFRKLKTINGDLLKSGLGLSDEDRDEIKQKVTIVYHVAASVRFNMPLHEAILLNVRGTREICKLVLELKYPAIFLHVSTAYCHIDKYETEEKVYPPKGNWKEVIEVAESIDQSLFKILSAKFVGHFPNSYTFTKSLVENLVVDMCEGNVATVILRPTVVMPAYKGSIPGWSDNFNGPLGIMIGMNVGIIRSIYMFDEIKYDYIPVDDTINSMIKAVWMQQFLNPEKVFVYNSSCHNLYEVDINLLLFCGRRSLDQVVLKPFWHANLYATNSKLVHYIHLILFHVFPLFLLDLALRVYGKKPMFVDLQRKVFSAIKSYEYFYLNSWIFRNERCLELDNHVLPSDKNNFCNDLRGIDYLEYFMTMAKQAQVLLLKEDPKNQDIYRKRRKLIKFAHYFLKYSLLAICFWWICKVCLNYHNVTYF